MEGKWYYVGYEDSSLYSGFWKLSTSALPHLWSYFYHNIKMNEIGVLYHLVNNEIIIKYDCFHPTIIFNTWRWSSNTSKIVEN